MALRVGIMGVAHVHTGAYVAALGRSARAELVGFHEPDAGRAATFAEATGAAPFSAAGLLEAVDAVVLSGTNVQHVEFALAAFGAGRHVLSEKPIATTLADADRMIAAAGAAGRNLMTGFPCRFSPAYARLKTLIGEGVVGSIVGISSTNRGTCPFGWFVETAESGGGAMIDHTVHVADLLRDLLGEEPEAVQAYVGSNVYGKAWEDTAMLAMSYPGGVFATLDSSWSRPKNFRTWGDVTLRVVGERGVLELDMFGQSMQATLTDRQFADRGFGSDLDGPMIDEFVDSCLEGRPPRVDGEAGRAALRVALMGYESLARPAGEAAGRPN